MEFRLLYQGRLPAQSQSNTRPREKHAIRKVLHLQLMNQWNAHAGLRVYVRSPGIAGDARNPSMIHVLANGYEKCGFRFLPLVNERFGTVACALDILFLRRDQPGDLVRDGGDIDNRIKVLFDALKVPSHCEELGGAVPEDGEDPLFCLLEDDKLITEVKITTDRLLTPLRDDESVNDVHLVINVRTVKLGPSVNWSFT
jgi:hypothetical protein